MTDDLKQKAKTEGLGLLLAVVIALVIRTFFFQPFNIPSGSMYPTLEVGDFLFVSKYPYGYGNTAYPFHLKFYEGRLFSSTPKRGEIVVFNNHKRPDLDFIKRCVGLPGDRIQMKEGKLHINGEPTKLEYVGLYTYVNQMGQQDVVKKYKETIPGSNGSSDVEHFILKKFDFGKAPLDNTKEFVVPEGHYFMVGDNRDGSSDSREMESLGFIPHDSLIGRAEILFFSTDAKLFKHADSRWWELWDLDFIAWIPGIRWSRLLLLLK